MITSVHRPRDIAGALSILRADPSARPLAGGTWLLTPAFRSQSFPVVCVDRLLPRTIARTDISRSGFTLEIGAGATFQSLVDSGDVPAVLARAASGMANRNIRNRATVGGNVIADKSCSSLVPLFLVSDAGYQFADGPDTLPATIWDRRGTARLMTTLRLRFDQDRRYGCARWSRTACDLSLLTVAVSYRLEAGRMEGVQVACGGLGPAVRRFPELESFFESRTVPGRDGMEHAIRPLLEARDDFRGSASFKRYRAAILVADAILAAEVQA